MILRLISFLILSFYIPFVALQNTCPFPPPTNQTSYHAGHFSSSLIVLDLLGNVAIKATVPNVVGRTVMLVIGGSPKNVSNLGQCSLANSVVNVCDTEYTLVGNLTSWMSCPGWKTSGTNVLTLINYAWLVWNDTLSGGIVRTSSTSVRLQGTFDRDVMLESFGPLTLEAKPPSIKFTSILYNPADRLHNATLEVGYSVVVPCPFTPTSVNVTVVLVKEEGLGWYPEFRHCVTGPIGLGSSNACGNGTFTTMSSGSCNVASQTYSGSLVFQMLDNCFADGNYSFSWKSGGNWQHANLTLDDGFDLCGLGNVNSGVNASMGVKGSGSVQVGDPVYFNGNVSGYGLPLAKVAMTDAVVVNTATQFKGKRRRGLTVERDGLLEKRAKTSPDWCVPSSTVLKNVAVVRNGGSYSCSTALYNGNDFSCDSINNGNRYKYWAQHGGGWNDATQGVFPDWVAVEFDKGYKLEVIDMVSMYLNYNGGAPIPKLNQDAKGGQITNYQIQYWNNGGWVTLESIQGNQNVWTRHQANVFTKAVRVYITACADGTWSRIQEVEAYARVPAKPCVSELPNGAKSANGWVCLGNLFVPVRVRDGTIACLQGNGGCQSFGSHGECVSALNGLTVNSPSVACGKEMVEMYGVDGWFEGGPCGVAEAALLTDLLTNNVASKLSGATVVASSERSGYEANGAIDGEISQGWGMGTGWSSTGLPAELIVNFGKSSCVLEFDYYTLGDVGGIPSQSTMAIVNGDTSFTVDYWDKGKWINVVGISGNKQAWRRIVLGECVTTDRLRVTVKGSNSGKSGLMEFQAWTEETMMAGTSMDFGGGWRDSEVFKSDDVDLDGIFGTDGWWMGGNVGSLPGWISVVSVGGTSNVDGVKVDDAVGGNGMTLVGTCGKDGKVAGFKFDAGGSVLPTDVRIGVSVDGVGQVPLGVTMRYGEGMKKTFDLTLDDAFGNGVVDWLFFDLEPEDGIEFFVEVVGSGCIGLIVIDGVVEIPEPTNKNNLTFAGMIPTYVNSMFTSGDASSFAQKAKWKAGFGDDGDTEWSGDGVPVKELKNATLDTRLPFVSTLTPFAGKSLGNSFVTKSQYGESGLGFGLAIGWRAYFDVKTAEGLGFRRRGLRSTERSKDEIKSGARYMLSKRAETFVGLTREVKVEAKVGLIAPLEQVIVLSAPKVEGVNKGAIIGGIVGGVILLVTIGVVGVVVKRKRNGKVTGKKTGKQRKSKRLEKMNFV